MYLAIILGITTYIICHYFHVTNYKQVVFGVVLLTTVFFTPHN